LPEGLLVAIRLGEGNNGVLDYILLPTSEMIGSKIRFMEAGLHRFDGRSFRTSAQLTTEVLHEILGCVTRASRVLPTTPRRLKERQEPARAKRKNAHARR
jgi:hypothetical protein